MIELPSDPVELRAYRNRKLYRSLVRITRVYNRFLIDGLRARGFADFSPAYPALLANLDTEGTRIGVLAMRAGVTRQAAGQLLAEIEATGYATTSPDPDDGRATIAMFTPKGRRMLANVADLVEEFEGNLTRFAPAADVARLFGTMTAIANGLDPEGALGTGDRAESPAPRKRRPSKPRPRVRS
jgi:DNA-binding MarR family transcriptional regulator